MYSTVIIWIAFIPAYFAVDSALLQVMFLSLQVIANAYLILICIFIPKVYAMYFVDKKDLHVTPKFKNQGGSRRLVENCNSVHSSGSESPAVTIMTDTGHRMHSVVESTIHEESEEETSSNSSQSESDRSTEHNVEAIKEEHEAYAWNGVLNLKLSPSRSHAMDGLL